MKHTFRKCLSLVLALATLLSVCVVPLAAADEECDHYAYKDQWVAVGTQDPTCVEYGGEAYLCGKCGERFVDRDTWVDPLGHDKKIYEEKKPTAIDHTGYQKWECQRCGVLGEDKLNYNRCKDDKCDFEAQAVVYLDENGVSDPCDQPGIIYNKCKKCGYMEVKETKPAVGHKWTVTIKVAPVCGTPEVKDDPNTPENEYKAKVEPVDGVLSFSCSVCKEVKEDEIAKAQTEHKLVWYDYVAPTCEKDGNKAGYKCAYCAYVDIAGDGLNTDTETEEDFVIDALEHTEKQQLTGKDYPTYGATCVDGQEWYLCGNENCDYEDKVWKKVLKADEVGYHAVGHANSALGNLVAATCFSDAYRVCSVCREKIYDTSKEEYKKHHNWYDWGNDDTVVSFDVAPTCTTQGYKTYLCKDCNYTFAENIPATGHKRPDNYSVISATCTTPAYLTYICLNENCPGEDLEGKPLTGKVVMEAIEGSKPLGHVVPMVGITEHAATCDTRAWREYDCLRSGCTGEKLDGTTNNNGIVEEYVSAGALGHEWRVIIPAVEATCVANGATAVRQCTRPGCGKYDSDKYPDANADGIPDGGIVIEASGHSYELVEDIPANCLYKKHDGYVCIECGHECLGGAECTDGKHVNHDLTEYLLEKATNDHVYTKYSREVTTAPTCTDTGLMREFCDICALKKDNVAIPALGHAYGSVPVGTVPATCNSKGFEVFYCAVCDTLNETNKFNLDPGARDEYDSHWVNVDADDATSIPGGFIVGDGYMYNPLTAEFKLNRTHCTEASSTRELEGINEGKGSCSVNEYYVWLCGVSGFKFVKEAYQEIKDPTTGDVIALWPYGQHIVKVETIPASCTNMTSGWIGRKTCERCTDKDGNPTILDKGVEVPWAHAYDTSNPEQKPIDHPDNLRAPTCTDNGVISSGWCTICGTNGESKYVEVPGKKLDHKVNGELALEWVEKSIIDDCYTDKYNAHWGCALCDYVVDASCLVAGELPTKKNDEGKEVLDESKIKWFSSIAASTGMGYVNIYTTAHKFVTPVVVYPACMKDGYTYYECENPGCSEIKVTDYQLGYANHKYTDTTHGIGKVVECTDAYHLCENVVTKLNPDGKPYTTECGDKLIVKEAKPHTNKYGVALACTNWPENTENKADFYVCKYCDADLKDGVKDERVHGNFDVVYVPASCTMPQHDLKTCTECGYVFIVRKPYEDDGGKMKDHDFTKIKENSEVYPTTWTGYYTYDLLCSMCGKDDGKETKDKLAEVYFSMAIGNKYDAAAVLVNGSRVTVTINMSTPATDIYSVSMAVKFNNKILEWVDTKEKVTNAFGYNVTEVYCDNNGMNTVEIYAHAESTADKKIQNVSVKGTQKLVTLEFEIKPTAYAKTEAAIKDAITFGDITVLQYDASVIGKEGYAIGDEFKVWKYDESATATDADKIKVATEVAYGGICYKAETNKGAYELKIMKLADLNGDGVVGLVDAGIFNDLMNGTKYNAQADLNKDGMINNADYILMRQYMVEKISYAELTKR